MVNPEQKFEFEPQTIRELAQALLHIREVLTFTDSALRLQAKEYERRLDGLNGEADRLKAMQATYVPADIYGVRHAVLEAADAALATRMGAVERNVWLATGGLAMLGIAWSIVQHFSR